MSIASPVDAENKQQEESVGLAASIPSQSLRLLQWELGVRLRPVSFDLCQQAESPAVPINTLDWGSSG